MIGICPDGYAGDSRSISPSEGSTLTPTRGGKVFSTGYFFCFVNKPEAADELFLWAPDSGRIATLAEGASRATLIETGISVRLGWRVEAVELISEPSGARKGPRGFGSELAGQCDCR